MKSSNFFIGVNGLRAIAILSVAMLHFSTAFIDYNSFFDRDILDNESLLRKIHRLGMDGVYLFFGISGFLITNALLKQPFSYEFSIAFIKKRVLRIYPPFIASILSLLIVQYVFSEYSLFDLIKSGFISSFFMHDLILKEYSIINPVTWSLEVEVQFYLFAAFFIPIFVTNRKFLISLFSIIIVSLILNSISFRENFDSRFFSDYINYFFSGTLACIVYKFSNNKLGNNGFIYDVLFLSCLLIFFHLDNKIFQSTLLLVVILLSFRIKFLLALFDNRIFNYISKVSYTYYLFHYAMFHLFMKIFSNKITINESFELSVTLGMFLFIPLSFLIIYPFYFFLERNHEVKMGYFEYLKSLWGKYLVRSRW
ncbi:hypothetical protein A143_09705 [Vibrio splendidus ZS-139]|nr:hypothetical protein A143_09705 [Vibrio splendidus ZS-139]